MSHILKFKPGHSQCPACTLAQRELEPYTAVPTEDGRIYCYACHHVTTVLPHGASAKIRELPDFLQGLVYSLVTFQTDPKNLQFLRGNGEVPAANAVPPTYTLTRVGKDELDLSDGKGGYDAQRASLAAG